MHASSKGLRCPRWIHPGMETIVSDIQSYCRENISRFTQLEQKIASAWNRVLIPPGYKDVGGSEDAPDEFGAVYRKYANKHWRQVLDEDISGYHGSIVLMASNEGKAYYVSAHLAKFLRLIKSLDQQSSEAVVSRVLDEAGMNLDHIISVARSVCDAGDTSRVFTHGQRAILNDFFQAIKSGFEDYFEEFNQLNMKY